MVKSSVVRVNASQILLEILRVVNIETVVVPQINSVKSSVAQRSACRICTEKLSVANIKAVIVPQINNLIV